MSVESLLSRIKDLTEKVKTKEKMLAESSRITNVFLYHENTDPNRNYDGYNGQRHDNSFFVAMDFNGNQKVQDWEICFMKDAVKKMKALYIENLKTAIAEDKKELAELISYKAAIEEELDKLEKGA